MSANDLAREMNAKDLARDMLQHTSLLVGEHEIFRGWPRAANGRKVINSNEISVLASILEDQMIKLNKTPDTLSEEEKMEAEQIARREAPEMLSALEHKAEVEPGREARRRSANSSVRKDLFNTAAPVAPAAPAAPAAPIPPRAAAGLSPRLQSFVDNALVRERLFAPVLVRSAMNGTETDCPICYQPLTKNVVIIESETQDPIVTKAKGVKCGHKFHRDCLEDSLKVLRSRGEAEICPMCRQEVIKIHDGFAEPTAPTRSKGGRHTKRSKKAKHTRRHRKDRKGRKGSRR